MQNVKIIKRDKYGRGSHTEKNKGICSTNYQGERRAATTRTAEVIGRQLLRCGTSVGANYRSACRAKSFADFIAKMAIVEEEADEVVYWLDLLVESGLLQQRHITRSS
jgi:four helix bundle protein